MKHIRGFAIIMLIAFVGECANALLPLPIPASIYGLVLLFIALQTGLLAEETIAKPAGFLLEVMPLMFVPAAVGILDVWGVLQQQILPILVIVCLSTLLVAYCTGMVAQRVIGALRRKEDSDGTI